MSRRIVPVAAVLGLVVAGFLFRMWLIGLAPQGFAWDQGDYEWFAKDILRQGWLASHSYRSYPYPLLMAVIYSFVGVGNHAAIYVANALMDVASGLLVFFILRRGFKMGWGAWVGIITYSFNPFTSGFVGVLLTEIMDGLFIVATIAVGVLFIRKPSILLGALVGVCAAA